VALIFILGTSFKKIHVVCEQLLLSFYKHVTSYRSYMALYEGI